MAEVILRRRKIPPIRLGLSHSSLGQSISLGRVHPSQFRRYFLLLRTWKSGGFSAQKLNSERILSCKLSHRTLSVRHLRSWQFSHPANKRGISLGNGILSHSVLRLKSVNRIYTSSGRCLFLGVFSACGAD